MPSKPIQLGPITVKSGHETPSRVALMIWGPATAGKTTFAATAPGVKLWLSFGDNETVPIQRRPDVRVADFSGLGYDELFRLCQNDNPFGLDTILAENEEIGTVVCDSATAVAWRALQKSVYVDRTGASKRGDFVPTMVAPGLPGYGGRNNILLEFMTGLLRVTAKHNVHCIITAHESDPILKIEGGKEVIDYIAVSLGGQLVNNMTFRLSEIWNIRQTGEKRLLTVRQYGLRKPMKTRMFRVDQPAQFELKYDPNRPDDDPKQMTITAWHEEWLTGHRMPISVPGV